MIIGITGPIGSGKTTAAKIFSRHHFARIDADEIGHRIIKKNSVAYKKIIKEFGNEILDKKKNIDRKKLGNIVFNDDKKLKKLNSIAHPIIVSAIKDKIKKIKAECGDNSKIVIDAPLLLETETKNLADKIIVVKSSKEKIVKRLSKKYTKEKIEKILKVQMPLYKKLKHADFVIDNSKGLKRLEEQVVKIINHLCSLSYK
ncbi:dephospho-CoA kinase [Candidatus Woesearchaeota archaeon]|nr:dephospho-CoA kinase [Candidatus Woesearchaeota archaeon]